MLENMRLLGKGNIAEVFEYGNEKVCKLFFEGYPDEYAALEFQNAREMYKNKIRISKPFQMITIENRKGIIYERIEGRTLLNIIMENETNLDMLLNTFVNLQINILSHHTKNVLSYKEYLIAILKNKKINNQVILNAINVLPDDDCLLHGEYDIARTYFLIKQFDGCLADKYLKRIGVSENNIEKYLYIIKHFRKYES